MKVRDASPLGFFFLLSSCDARTNTLRPASDYAHSIASIYWEAIGWYSLILILVAALVIAVLTRHSARRGERPEPPVHVDEHLLLEAAWTVGPAAILLLIAFPAVVINFKALPNKVPSDAMHIIVVGHQWWWEFRYPSFGIVTANEAHIPLNRKIYFELRTADVIHSFWVPRLGGKEDLIPNHYNELIFTPQVPGEYWGQCAEFCGLSHANMKICVFVDPLDKFKGWVLDQQSSARQPDLKDPNYSRIEEGMKVFEKAPCTTCHGIQGISRTTIAPPLTHLASRTTIAAGLMPNTPPNLAAWIQNPDRLKPGAKMPGMALSSEELSALATYLDSLR